MTATMMADMTSVWFRFRWLLREEALAVRGETQRVHIREDPETVGTLLAPGPDRPTWQSIATARVEISDSHLDILTDIAAGRLPAGCDLSQDDASNVPRWLSGASKALVLPVLPRPFKDLVQASRDDLNSQARRLVELVRWATNAHGSHDLFGMGFHEFSLDGETWVPAPKNPPGAPVDLHVAGMSTDSVNWPVLSAMALAGKSEPVGHSLVREALGLRRSAPRAAVVLGAAAAETAVKETIHCLAPVAAYLVDEMASPPVKNLVCDYLPRLNPVDETFRDAFPPPKPIRRSLSWLVETRNKVLHNPQQQHRFPELLTALLHVRDLVWLLDCYCGHAWALHHVSPEIREHLGL